LNKKQTRQKANKVATRSQRKESATQPPPLPPTLLPFVILSLTVDSVGGIDTKSGPGGIGKIGGVVQQRREPTRGANSTRDRKQLGRDKHIVREANGVVHELAGWVQVGEVGTCSKLNHQHGVVGAGLVARIGETGLGRSAGPEQASWLGVVEERCCGCVDVGEINGIELQSSFN